MILNLILSVVIALLSRLSHAVSPAYDNVTFPLFESCLSSAHVFYITNSTSSFLSIFHSRIHNLSLLNTSTPIFIVLPNTEVEAQGAITCFNDDHDLKSYAQLLIRGGGHSYEGYSYMSSIPFVLLDMQKMDAISVDVHRNTITVEGGATLGALYNTISTISPPNPKFAYGFPAGTCPTVGVGGHIQGGGIGVLTRKHGLALDNVLSMRVVTTDGKLLTVSNKASQNPDLFWALRGGGGGNFGLITSYNLKLVLVPRDIIQFSVKIPLTNSTSFISTIVKGLTEFQSFTVNATKDLSFLNIHWGKDNFAFQGLYLKNETEKLHRILSTGLPTFSSFMSAESYASIQYNASTLADPPLSMAFKAKSDMILSPLSEEGIRAFYEAMMKTDNAYAIINGDGGRMAEISLDSTAYSYREGMIMSIQYLTSWDPYNLSQELSRKHQLNTMYQQLRPYVSGRTYINYIDGNLGEYSSMNVSIIGQEEDFWNDKYFGQSHAKRLREIKRIYDPEDILRFPQSINVHPSTNVSTTSNRNFNVLPKVISGGSGSSYHTTTSHNLIVLSFTVFSLFYFSL